MDFDPGINTRSASPGRGRPASIISTVTSGCAANGSRSSKLAILFRRGTATLIAPPLRVATSITSSAGSFRASVNQGTIPSGAHPVCSATAVIPASNSVVSPRNLLTANALIRARSLGGKMTSVPTSCAITPPRSMSPIRITGQSAASAKPMLAMSPGRRFISAGEPAPSIKIKSCSAAKWR